MPDFKDSRGTQRARLLGLLIDARGREVPLTEIMGLRIAQYAARICELRKLGFRIPRPRIEVVNGQKHTFYRLDSGPPVEKNAPRSLPESNARSQPKPDTKAHIPQTLFGDITPDRSYME